MKKLSVDQIAEFKAKITKLQEYYVELRALREKYGLDNKPVTFPGKYDNVYYEGIEWLNKL